MRRESFRADLHIHSNASDGTLSSKQIVDLAKMSGIQGLSITDHDTLNGYTSEFYEYAHQQNMDVLRGVEISSELESKTIHILAYSFDDSLNDFLEQVKLKRMHRNARIFDAFKKRGIKISERDVVDMFPHSIIGRTHIAELMVKRKIVSTIQDAFDRYLRDEGSCYALGDKFTPCQVIQAIHDCRGVAILAHPQKIRRDSFLTRLLQMPFDGIECYYARFFKEQEPYWIQLATARGWIMTGGSDYHGDHRSSNLLGSSWVGEETFMRLKNQ